MRSTVIYVVDLALLVAGTKYRGEFEERFKALLVQIAGLSHPSILFIDEFHTVVGAGNSQGGMDASNLLKPALAKGEICCMGATTWQEYRKYIEKDRAMVRRFQIVEMKEPSEGESIRILEGIISRYEDHHRVQYTPEALRAAVRLSSRFIHDRKLPDKAIDVIDEAGALLGASGNLPLPLIGVPAIEDAVSKIARIPVGKVRQNEADELRFLGERLKSYVFGQDAAVDRLFRAVKIARAGLRARGKPIGSFLFDGPSGVGKSETAKQLAAALGLELIRFDMSEYSEKHAVSRLIGAPPGYEGAEEGGVLLSAVQRNPYCVLLLDEADKAHRASHDIFLQVFDGGRLTGTNGQPVNFENTIVILSANAGAREAERSGLGFGASDGGDPAAGVKTIFRTEFLNKLDGVVHFRALTPKVMLGIVDKFMAQLDAVLAESGIELQYGDDVRQWLADKGYRRTDGARPLEKLIEASIKEPMSDEIIWGGLKEGGIAALSIEGGAIAMKVISAAEHRDRSRKKRSQQV
jgi:ATP-dependent Clp protease ATP-binding subunit ClpA